MKTLEIVGWKRTDLGTKFSKQIRSEGNVPCVLYGGDEPVHFFAPMILFRDLIYTTSVHKVIVNVEGTIYEAILQDFQVHPVSEMLLHVDFLRLVPNKPVKLDIPVRLTGRPVGVQKGGRLAVKTRKVTVKATPENLPDSITIDISDLDLGKTVKVGHLPAEGFEILNSPSVSVASVVITRSVRKEQQEAAGK
ncbi:50S ribosomal protein L25/general stress protein Ctc [Hugenholtzia roseola]|uniref:50S ribosomal protein L25/general stress protein Ctc n=1 Tax=Hugenholtzia roseola TaxID=1002 RepID=UPI000418BFE6|nr:50S ribosomal protein L25/general stress protein Ctc [Hugenholtzia roseola]